jgi:hypothetical protein
MGKWKTAEFSTFGIFEKWLSLGLWAMWTRSTTPRLSPTCPQKEKSRISLQPPQKIEKSFFFSTYRLLIAKSLQIYARGATNWTGKG